MHVPQARAREAAAQARLAKRSWWRILFCSFCLDRGEKRTYEEDYEIVVESGRNEDEIKRLANGWCIPMKNAVRMMADFEIAQENRNDPFDESSSTKLPSSFVTSSVVPYARPLSPEQVTARMSGSSPMPTTRTSTALGCHANASEASLDERMAREFDRMDAHVPSRKINSAERTAPRASTVSYASLDRKSTGHASRSRGSGIGPSRLSQMPPRKSRLLQQQPVRPNRSAGYQDINLHNKRVIERQDTFVRAPTACTTHIQHAPMPC